MPELPEVETIRAQLDPRLAGRRFERAEVLDDKLTRPSPGAAVADALVGRRVERVVRRGKYLVLPLDGEDELVLHLRMTGRLHWREAGAPWEERYLRASFLMDDGSALTFADARRFGTLTLLTGRDERAEHWRGRVGVEPLSGSFSGRRLAELLDGRRGPIKPLLLNQRVVAGLGNMYVDEALFAARVHPERPAGGLGPQELRRLHRAIRDRLSVAIEAGGASIDSYRDSLGQRGTMQDLLRVHLHEGERCPRCRAIIRKTKLAGRGTYWCPRCQEAP